MELLNTVQGVFLLLQVAVFVLTPILLAKVNKAQINGIKDDIQDLRKEMRQLNQNFINHLSSHKK